MFGLTPAPTSTPGRRCPTSKISWSFSAPGDVVKFRPIDEEEYNSIRAAVQAGTYNFRQAPVELVLEDVHAYMHSSNARILEALDGG